MLSISIKSHKNQKYLNCSLEFTFSNQVQRLVPILWLAQMHVRSILPSEEFYRQQPYTRKRNFNNFSVEIEIFSIDKFKILV